MIYYSGKGGDSYMFAEVFLHLEVKLCLEVEHMICWLEPLEKWTRRVDTAQQMTAFQADFFPPLDWYAH